MVLTGVKEIGYITGDTRYQTNVEIPVITSPAGETHRLIDEEELHAHSDNDAAMYKQMTDNIKSSIEASLTNYITTAKTNTTYMQDRPIHIVQKYIIPLQNLPIAFILSLQRRDLTF